MITEYTLYFNLILFAKLEVYTDLLGRPDLTLVVTDFELESKLIGTVKK